MGFPHHGGPKNDAPNIEIANLLKRFNDQVNERAQRAYSEGRISASDDGDLSLAIAADHAHKVVRIDFGKEVTWLAFPAKDAVALAKKLIELAREISTEPIVLEI